MPPALRRLYDLLRSAPDGLTATTLGRITGASRQLVEYRLAPLLDGGLVVRSRQLYHAADCVRGWSKPKEEANVR